MPKHSTFANRQRSCCFGGAGGSRSFLAWLGAPSKRSNQKEGKRDLAPPLLCSIQWMRKERCDRLAPLNCVFGDFVHMMHAEPNTPVQYSS